VEQLILSALRRVDGSTGAEQALASRDLVGRQMCRATNDATRRWGVRVDQVEPRSIELSSSSRASAGQ
jgi:regulator of protease activity HflC (stomatin/prohibitin superfamily)